MIIENYEVRYVKLEEREKLQKFIDDYWKKDHILAHNTSLLDYQHANRDEGRYNFVVAQNLDTSEFDIVLGFIPHSQYDKSTKNKDIWLAIWKKNEVLLPRGLGKKLLDFIEINFQPTSIGSIGINDTIEQLYLKRGWKSGVLDVWYFIKAPELISFEEIAFSEEDFYDNQFAKGDEYYSNRYEKHPFYTYSTFNGIVYRKIETDKGNVLRIIDFKKKFYCNEYLLNELLVKEQADYIDCLNHGMDPELFKKMGFNKRSDTMRIPQWFEPLDFGVKNIKFAYKSDKDYFIVKGDSDQDRPNKIS